MHVWCGLWVVSCVLPAVGGRGSSWADGEDVLGSQHESVAAQVRCPASARPRASVGGASVGQCVDAGGGGGAQGECCATGMRDSSSVQGVTREITRRCHWLAQARIDAPARHGVCGAAPWGARAGAGRMQPACRTGAAAAGWLHACTPAAGEAGAGMRAAIRLHTPPAACRLPPAMLCRALPCRALLGCTAPRASHPSPPHHLPRPAACHAYAPRPAPAACQCASRGCPAACMSSPHARALCAAPAHACSRPPWHVLLFITRSPDHHAIT